MANTYLTITDITRETLRILHEKLTFVGTINRQYDSQFAKEGAKIGTSLRIRLPNQYTVRTGKTMNVQDSEETQTTLTVATQKGVDMGGFTSVDLAMKIDDFSSRYIEPAMAVLASGIEADVLQGSTKLVYNQTGSAGTTPNDMTFFGNARAKLNQYLAPKDKNRCIQIDSVAMASMVDTYKALFAPGDNISDQYLEGLISQNMGFKWYENERIYTHTNGTDHTTVTVNDASIASGDSTITTSGGNVTVGTVFTFSGTGVKAVHPETKDAYAHDQQFVITAVDGNDWTFDPPLHSTGAKQNVNQLPGNGSAITLVGSASTAYEQHLAYHKDFCTFVTADLPLYKGQHMMAREVYDGISIRCWQDADIVNDELSCRIDVLYGYKVLRPQLACRITG